MLDWLPHLWHGTLREHYVVLFGAAGAIALVTGSVSAWLGAHFGARRGAKRALREAGEQALAGAVSAELARLTQAIDTMAFEVERISEAQRFQARLVAERSGAPMLPPRREAGQITPH